MASSEVDEYIHLLSDNLDLEKGNFSNRLGQPFSFSASSEIFCGLKELSISCELESAHLTPKSDSERDKLRVMVAAPYLTGSGFTDISIDSGQYTSESLVSSINHSIQNTLGERFSSSVCRLWLNPISGKIEYFVDGNNPDETKRVSLLIFASLSYALGLQSTGETPKNFLIGNPTKGIPSIHLWHGVSSHRPGIKGPDLVFCYIDVLRRQRVGRELAQICDIFPRGQCIPGHTYSTFKNTAPKYIRIAENLRSIEKIGILLADEAGQIIKFSKGSAETRATLHFVSKSRLRLH